MLRGGEGPAAAAAAAPAAPFLPGVWGGVCRGPTVCAPPDPLPVGVPCLDGVPCLGGVPCAGRGGLLPVGVAVRVGVVVPLGVVWGGGRCGVVGVAERGGGVLAMALGGRCAGVGVPERGGVLVVVAPGGRCVGVPERGGMLVVAPGGRCGGVGVPERGGVLLWPLAMPGPLCALIGVGVVGLAGLLVLIAWAAVGVVWWPALMPDWGVPPWSGVVGRRAWRVVVPPAPAAPRPRNTLGSRSGMQSIQRSRMATSGVSSDFEEISTRRDWRKVMGLCSPFQHIWVMRAVSL